MKVAFTTRNTWMAKDNQAGLRFDIRAVQVLNLITAERTAEGFGFGVEEAPEDEEMTQDENRANGEDDGTEDF